MSTVAAHLIRTRKVSSGPPCSDTITCNMQPPCGLMIQWCEQPLAFRQHHILAACSKHDADTLYVVLQRTKQDVGNHARCKAFMKVVFGIGFLLGCKDNKKMDCTHSKQAEKT